MFSSFLVGICMISQAWAEDKAGGAEADGREGVGDLSPDSTSVNGQETSGIAGEKRADAAAVSMDAAAVSVDAAGLSVDAAGVSANAGEEDASTQHPAISAGG